VVRINDGCPLNCFVKIASHLNGLQARRYGPGKVAHGSTSGGKGLRIYCLSVQVTAPHSASHSSPELRFRSESDQRSAGQVQEAAVVRPSARPEKDGSAGQVRGLPVSGDERMLTLQRLGGATNWAADRHRSAGSDDLGEKLRNCAKPVGLMPVGPIERLSEDELPRVRVVAEIEPIGDAAPRGRERVMYFCSGSAAIDATDDEIKIDCPGCERGAQMLRDGLPIESPEQVQPVGENRLILNSPISLRGERWADQFAAEIRSPSDHGHRQADGCPARDERLVEDAATRQQPRCPFPRNRSRHFDASAEQVREKWCAFRSSRP